MFNQKLKIKYKKSMMHKYQKTIVITYNYFKGNFFYSCLKEAKEM